ncbi:MAG: hypothetical protein RQ748_08355 [Elusimicrobiales bacterium]|nr:hypothetical protein [Elusimicrobiales bacterium]
MLTLLYLTDAAHRNLIPDEKGIAAAFEAEGVGIDVRAWDGIDWTGWRNILIRTPWDYARRPGLFLEKLSAATAAGAAVIHSEKIVRWNIDKRYLVRLSEAGHRVVPTRVEEKFSAASLPGYFALYGPLVLKPRVGAGGADTFKVHPGDDPPRWRRWPAFPCWCSLSCRRSRRKGSIPSYSSRENSPTPCAKRRARGSSACRTAMAARCTPMNPPTGR